MNVELVHVDKFEAAQRLIEQGGDKTADGIAMLLIAKADYAADGRTSDGVNAGEVLNKALKMFQDNPYMALGVRNGPEATETEIKKSFRKYALKYHPDKTQNKTGLMFTVIQQAYTTLSDPKRRARHDEGVKRNSAKLEKMRKMKEAEDKQRTERRDGVHGCDRHHAEPPPSSTNSFRQPPQSQDEADYRAFNKRFYEEFRRKSSMRSKSPQKPRPPKGAPPSANDNSDSKPADKSKGGGPAAPAKPRSLRATSRSDTTITLEWRHGTGGQGDSTAYELQWRARGARLVEWETSTQLILGSTCRKKNLVPSTCYEFRVRAASAWGWSGYGEPVMVVTNAAASGSSSGVSTTTSASSTSTGWSQKQASWNKGPPSKELHKRPMRDQHDSSTSPSAVSNWDCVVCKRTNGPDAAQCAVCYTKRSYRASKLHHIQQSDGLKAQTGYKKSSVREVGGQQDLSQHGTGEQKKPSSRPPQFHPDIKSGNSWTRPQSAHAWSKKDKDVPSTDRGYHSANPSGMDYGVDESDEEYGDEAWEFSETDVHDDDPFSEFNNPSSSPSPSAQLQIGDTVVAIGLTAAEYNGLLGEVRSGLMDDRHQVELRLKDGTKKDLRMKPANLKLKRRKSGGVSRNSSDGGASGGGDRPQSLPSRRQAFGTPEELSSRDVGGGDGDEFNGARTNIGYEGAGFPKIYWLNTPVTKLHNVRSEPIKESTIVGHLRADRQVLAMAEVGDWLKVEWHSPYDNGGSVENKKISKAQTGAGWCLVGDTKQKYLIEDMEGGVDADMRDPGNSSETDGGSSGWEFHYAQRGAGAEGDLSMEDIEEVIYELRDESGDLYYFNGATGVSCWDPPEWIDSTDPVSGAVYYENTVSGETQWDKPWDFIPVLREEAYSTPEAQFIKSVLSPKRSRGPRNFYSPGEA